MVLKPRRVTLFSILAIPYERNEFDANNHYNCPIVTSYSENIKNNVDEIKILQSILKIRLWLLPTKKFLPTC